jgi:ABC-type transport system substrate-binding protein/class 3 adenylate cyclase
MAVVAQRRIVTVLFADIVGSTAIGEQLGPERSKLLIDEVMRLMSSEVERFEGTVAQFVGDELYALFGAPIAHEDDSERAALAGLAIQRALGRYAAEVREAYGIELSVRIAINTGPVVIDPESEDPYNALGETVNTAARIQELASGGEIVVGAATRLQIEHCFELEPLGEQSFRGLSAPVEIYRVRGQAEADGGPPIVHPLVGREFELTVLERAIEGLAEGRGVIVSIIGEPGIGKSRLLTEARRHMRERVRFIEGRAVSYAESFPYWPIKELVRDWLSAGAATPEARVRLELKAELERLLPEESDAAYPFVASLAGLALEPDAAARIRELSRESSRHQTFVFLSELVCRLSEEAPVCLVLEDLHWADEATLELLADLLPVTEEAAVGLLLLHRDERDHGSWRLGERARQRYPHRYRELELRPLPEDASRALVTNAAEAELPESVARLLADRAGGNPFFLEEALRDLLERGALQRENGRLVLAVREDELAVPALVQGTLQARLDRLGATARDTVSVAAVAGRSFSLALLERVVPREDVLPALSELQRLDLVVEERRRPVPEYRFRHGLVQEVAYASLIDAKRRKLHLRVGEALEALHPDAKGEVLGLLARHFTEADEPARAVDYLLQAGDAARAFYADHEALEHYDRAREFLARLGEDGRARDTLFKIALTHHLAFDFERAENAYDEAFCCRVDEAPLAEATELLETVLPDPLGFIPGHVYTVEGVEVVGHLFRGLLTVDSALTVVPDMADNFRVSSDGLNYLFRLREGARWSDGVPLTADDFVFAWRRLREDQSPTAFLLTDIASAEALDDRTLEVRVREPRSYFPYVLAEWAMPWPRHRCEELGEAWRRPENLVSNGPFAIADAGDGYVQLEANPYWTGARGNVREIRIEFTSRQEALEKWRAGRFDVMTSFTPLGTEAPDTEAQTVSLLSMHHIGFRADREPFSCELLRRAFAHALDRSKLGPIFDLSRLATRGGAVPPAMPGHSSRAGPDYDIELARRLLEEAGYPEGNGLPEVELAVPRWVDRTDVLVDQWAELGVHVRVRHAAEPNCHDLDDTTDMWLSGWTPDFPDPEGVFLGLYGREYWPLYRDDALDELLARARSLQDQPERMRLYHEFDRTWVRERAALIPLAYGRAVQLHRPWVDGVSISPLGRASLELAVVSR